MAKRKSTKPSKAYEPNHENDPTHERIKRAQGVVSDFKTDTGRRTKRLNAILDHMLSHGMIDRHQYAAGMEAYRQWDAAGFNSVGAMDLAKERVDGSSQFDSLQYHLDNAKKFGASMTAIGLTMARAFREMVLHEMAPHEYGFTYYGYKDRASASAVAYSMLKDTLTALDLAYTGGKRPHNAKTRSHMAPDAKPSNNPLARGI